MSEKLEKEEVVILIAEDDDGHAELIEEHLRDSGLNNVILRFYDGQEVWDFLTCTGNGPHMVKEQAYLLLLDIRMPRMDGVEVLRRIKEDKHLKSIPVIMLTTTDDAREMEECYRLGCNCYVTKPVDFNRFAETLKTLGLFVLILRVSRINVPDNEEEKNDDEI